MIFIVLTAPKYSGGVQQGGNTITTVKDKGSCL